MLMRKLIRPLLLATSLMAATGSQASDNGGVLLMVVDATGRSIPTAIVHVMTSKGSGDEKDFTSRNYQADPNGVVLIRSSDLPQKPGIWAWCADALGYDGTFQNLIAPGSISLDKTITARLLTIKYPRHCNLIGKPGFNLLNPRNAPQEIFPERRLRQPRPPAASGAGNLGHALKLY